MLKMDQSRPLKELVALAEAGLRERLAVLGASGVIPTFSLVGDGAVEIESLAASDEATSGSLTFAVAESYLEQAVAAGVAAVIIPLSLAGVTLGLPVLVTPEPRLVFAVLLDILGRSRIPKPLSGMAFFTDRASVELGEGVIIGPGAHIGRGVRLGARSIIGPQVFLDDGVVVGEDCQLHPRVVLRWGTRVGNRCQIHSGAVIGEDGFGYTQLPDPGNGRLFHIKNEHLGGVVIEDDVEIGAQSCIDRGLVADTCLGRGSKIDNLVQIGHNVQLGRDCIVVAQVGIGGHTVVEDRAFLLGQVGLGPGVTVGADAILTAQSGIGSGRVPRGHRVWSGTPIRVHKEFYETLALSATQLPKVRKFFQILKKCETLGELKQAFFGPKEKDIVK